MESFYWRYTCWCKDFFGGVVFQCDGQRCAFNKSDQSIKLPTRQTFTDTLPSLSAVFRTTHPSSSVPVKALSLPGPDSVLGVKQPRNTKTIHILPVLIPHLRVLCQDMLRQTGTHPGFILIKVLKLPHACLQTVGSSGRTWRIKADAGRTCTNHTKVLDPVTWFEETEFSSKLKFKLLLFF